MDLRQPARVFIQIVSVRSVVKTVGRVPTENTETTEGGVGVFNHGCHG